MKFGSWDTDVGRTANTTSFNCFNLDANGDAAGREQLNSAI